MLKTITLDLGETNELDQFLDEYVLDEMRGAINDLDLSESTIAHMQKLLDKTKRHFKSQIVETETDPKMLNEIQRLRDQCISYERTITKLSAAFLMERSR